MPDKSVNWITWEKHEWYYNCRKRQHLEPVGEDAEECSRPRERNCNNPNQSSFSLLHFFFSFLSVYLFLRNDGYYCSSLQLHFSLSHVFFLFFLFSKKNSDHIDYQFITIQHPKNKKIRWPFLKFILLLIISKTRIVEWFIPELKFFLLPKFKNQSYTLIFDSFKLILYCYP